MSVHCVVNASGSFLVFLVMSRRLGNVCCGNIFAWNVGNVANIVAWSTSVWFWQWITYESVLILIVILGILVNNVLLLKS